MSGNEYNALNNNGVQLRKLFPDDFQRLDLVCPLLSVPRGEDGEHGRLVKNCATMHQSDGVNVLNQVVYQTRSRADTMSTDLGQLIVRQTL
jgi:hypothetical protein